MGQTAFRVRGTVSAGESRVPRIHQGLLEVRSRFYVKHLSSLHSANHFCINTAVMHTEGVVVVASEFTNILLLLYDTFLAFRINHGLDSYSVKTPLAGLLLSIGVFWFLAFNGRSPLNSAFSSQKLAWGPPPRDNRYPWGGTVNGFCLKAAILHRAGLSLSINLQ